ncbi:MAG: hypothetical protein CMJ24_00745 [Phycisphaerae bacterium]|nr:hypothetical protein [Phycisphaerae bacterium]
MNVPDAQEILTTIGWTITHFLWQGAVICIITFIALRLNPTFDALHRYATSCLAMVACALCVLTTFFVLLDWPAMHITPSGTAVQIDASVASRLASTTNWPDLVAWIWMVGVAVMATRFIRNWLGTHRLRSHLTHATDPRWQRMFDSIIDDLGMNRRITLVASSLAEVPMVVGWLKPVVLIPVSAFTALTPDQVHLVLAHELSHIRRKDHIVNLCQCVIETMLFFHPAVWWLSRRIRIEREHCCDDASLEVSGSPRLLAETLFKLKLSQINHCPEPSLAATGGTLMQRIQRLRNHQPSCTPRSGHLALCGAFLLIAASGLTISLSTGNAVAEEPAGDTTREAAGEIHPSAESKADAQLAELKTGIEARISAIMADLDGMVEAGSITKKDAQARLAAAERQMWTRYRQAEMELKGDETVDRKTLADYDEAKAKMKKMVEAGEITSEQMQQRLDQMNIRRAIAGEALLRDSGRMKNMTTKERTFTRKDYAEAEASMQKMVEAGEITSEQMQQRLDRMKKMVTKEQTFTRRDYADAEAKMQKMVEAGEITREQMQQRLDRMKEMMRKENARITRQDYADAEAKMQKMVEAGEITREQMQQRLDRMKEMMRRDVEERSQQPSNDCMELRRKLGEAVRAGEMTREEAGEVWRSEGC